MNKKLLIFSIACVAIIISVWISNKLIHVDLSIYKPTVITQDKNQEQDQATQTIIIPESHATLKKKLSQPKAQAQSEPFTLSQITKYTSKYGPLPKTLRGTHIDGELLLDANGNLIITHGIRNLFEYFLAARSEESLDIILGRIKEYIRKHIPEAPANQAISILNDYMAYQKKLGEIERPEGFTDEELGSLDSIKDALSRRMLVRRQMMSKEVVQAFFGDEEKYDQFNLQLIDIKQNAVLSPEAKEEEIIALEEMLPDNIRQMRTEERLREKRNQTIEQMRKQGKSEAEIYEFRKKEMGVDAADRWTQLENQRKLWNQKVDDFMKQRKEITSDPNMTPQEQMSAIDRLKFESFEESEMRRIDFEEKLRLQQESPE